MSRRRNCYENIVAESFFSSLKRERIRRRIYRTRKEARQDVFDYVEMFYDPVRKQVRNGTLLPVAFERQQVLKSEGVSKSRGCSLWQCNAQPTASSKPGGGSPVLAAQHPLTKPFRPLPRPTQAVILNTNKRSKLRGRAGTRSGRLSVNSLRAVSNAEADV